MISDSNNIQELDLECVNYLSDFIQPLFFPWLTTWENRHILYLGESVEDRNFHILGKEFAGAKVHFMDFGDVIQTGDSSSTYDYIAALGLKSVTSDIGVLLSRLISWLKPGGVLAAAVHGYSGYYGLDMLGRIIKNFSRDLCDPFMAKNFPRVHRITRAVLEQLPQNHPAQRRPKFLESLGKGDKKRLRELFNLSADNIYKVSRWLECVQRCGGQFIAWLLPHLYNPALYVKGTGVDEKLERLEGPVRWSTAELINAYPPEHFFFLGKSSYQPIRIAWDSGDLFLWRPRRLPLYQWERVSGTDPSECILGPLPGCRGIDEVELQPWQVRLCLSASGTISLDHLMADLNIPHLEVLHFLQHALELRLLALLPPG